MQLRVEITQRLVSHWRPEAAEIARGARPRRRQARHDHTVDLIATHPAISLALCTWCLG